MAQMVRLGKTEITVNKNGFGALPIQRISFDEAKTLLRTAYDSGIRYFDTARAYTDSEEKIAYALSDVREEIFIATKTTAKNAEDFWKDLNQSLKSLQTDYIDVYQLHNPPFCPVPGDESGLYDAMLEAKAQGKIKHIGITNHRLSVATEAVKSGLYELLQYPFCYLATEEEQALVNLCKELNVGFVCMKGMSGGLITDYRPAYAFIAQFENALPIWGVQRERELAEFISCIDNPPAMTEEIVAIIEKDRTELMGSFCRSCAYCMPCPVGIDIPQAARMSLLLRRMPVELYITPYFRENMELIDSCVNCRKCAKSCPYGLDTPELLKQNLKDYREFISKL